MKHRHARVERNAAAIIRYVWCLRAAETAQLLPCSASTGRNDSDNDQRGRTGRCNSIPRDDRFETRHSRESAARLFRRRALRGAARVRLWHVITMSAADPHCNQRAGIAPLTSRGGEPCQR